MSENNSDDGYPTEIKLDLGESVNWADALEELEGSDEGAAASKPREEAPAPPAPKPAADNTPIPIASEKPVREERPLTKYEELCKKRSVTMGREDLDVFTELSDMLCSVNESLAEFQKVIGEHPELIQKHIAKTCEDNLKDTAAVMFKEFHALRNGRMNKTYDPKCVCKQCHTVYMVPLPGDGLCDECRAAEVPRQAP